MPIAHAGMLGRPDEQQRGLALARPAKRTSASMDPTAAESVRSKLSRRERPVIGLPPQSRSAAGLASTTSWLFASITATASAETWNSTR